ncbi:MAG TPA: hypothetical protein VES20_25625 [Bryobacteraceae bacterium]|nr:hypothetical protein [Bryobacteraceae bacterium]
MSSFGFKSLEHALATAARDVVIGARAISTVSAKVQKAEPVIEQITALIDPPAVVVERAAFAALAAVAKAANDTSAASAAQGLNIQLDEQMLEDFRQVYATLVKALHKNSQQASAPLSGA